ncbi:5-deoxy-glucuronate isomerase [Streptomyces canus]|uniref:5-deoxy-glucuronate isomerase n=1 Tax=Streptomyces canus TaxID=58343 RepID=UPI00368C43EE
MTFSGTYHLPKGASADGPYDLATTPESSGWAYSGLRILTLRPGEEHAPSTGENEFLVLPLNGGCTVAVDGRSFELGGRTDVFPSARTERGGHSARYGRKEDVPVEPRGAGACSRQVNNYCLPGTFQAEQLPPHKNGFGCHRGYGTEERPIDELAEVRSGDTVLIRHGRVRDTWASQDVDDRLPFEGSRQR